MYTAGARVRLKDLKAKPELNGREGLCKSYKPDTCRWTICLEPDGAEVAIKVVNLDLVQPVTQATKGGGKAVAKADVVPSQANGEKIAPQADSVLEGLDRLLSKLETSRQAVCDVMIYCMDNEMQYGAPVARRLVTALVEKGLSAEAHIGRLFVISDLLHNSRSQQALGRGAGGAKFGASFQELLPEAFISLGAHWLRVMPSMVEKVRAEEAVRKVLKVWQDWGMFPSQFTMGLECLLLAPIYDIQAKEASNETDVRLRQKLQPWFSGINQAQLPYSCRMRGLSGKSLKATDCRVRLCHFERYWHLVPGVTVRLQGLQAAATLNGCIGVLENLDRATGRWNVRLKSDGQIKAVKADNLISEEPEATAGNSRQASAVSSTAPPPEEDENHIDGVPLTFSEWALVEETMIAEARAERKRLQGLPTLDGRMPRPKTKEKNGGKSGSWTQVWHSDPDDGACPVDGPRHDGRTGNGDSLRQQPRGPSLSLAELKPDPKPEPATRSAQVGAFQSFKQSKRSGEDDADDGPGVVQKRRSREGGAGEVSYNSCPPPDGSRSSKRPRTDRANPFAP